jgi:hypothetical protein
MRRSSSSLATTHAVVRGQASATRAWADEVSTVGISAVAAPKSVGIRHHHARLVKRDIHGRAGRSQNTALPAFPIRPPTVDPTRQYDGTQFSFSKLDGLASAVL